jgi:hypothetical protein
MNEEIELKLTRNDRATIFLSTKIKVISSRTEYSSQTISNMDR